MDRLKLKLWSRVGLMVVVLLMGATSVAAATAWVVVPSPNPGVSGNELNAVAVVAANDVWAVGESTGVNGASRTLIEHWDGARWRIAPSPNSSTTHNVLRGVAAVATDDVWAVGWFDAPGEIPQTLIEHWDGATWRVVTSPNVGRSSNFLYAVAASSATDVWAVGQFSDARGFFRTLVEHWDGTAWRVVPSPSGGTHDNVLNGVTAASASDVWAVGDFLDASATSHTLIEHWDGTAWQVVPSPSGVPLPNVLNAVQAISATDVWAVGQASTHTLVERWDGSVWQVVPSPNPSASSNSLLNGLAVVSPGPEGASIWAVGFDVAGGRTLIEYWNGTRWAVVPSPNPGPNLNFLRGVAADPVSGQSWAVGEFFNASGADQTLVEVHP